MKNMGTEDVLARRSERQVAHVAVSDCRHALGQRRVLEGERATAAVRELVSYEGLYSDVADVGTVVEAYGKLETVNGTPSRLVIGTTHPTHGFIKPLARVGS